MSSQVQGTNDSSIVSKHSMASQGYFQDKYIRYFVAKKGRRSPLINIGYYVRAVVIEKVLQQFISCFKCHEIQILSLGAGFDTSWFRLSDFSSSENFIYFEVDLPDVVTRKSAVIKSLPELTSKLKNVKVGYSGIWSEQFRLFASDLRNLTEIKRQLIENDFDFGKPTLLLAECSITYMDEISSRRLIEFTEEILKDAIFVTYEQISPNDPFGNVMVKHFQNINSPLLSVELYPSLADQERRFLKEGWETCHAVGVWDAYLGITSEDEQTRILNLEPFDEWEEWHLKCNHYTLVVASKGICKNWTPFHSFLDLKPIGKHWNDVTLKLVKLDSRLINVRQYGHRSVMLSNNESENYIIAVGGFGQAISGSHKRLENIRCFNVTEESALREIETISHNNILFNVMHHSCTVIDEFNKKILLYGGRQSPHKCVYQDPIVINCCIIDNRLDFETKRLINETNESVSQPKSRWRHTACFINFNENKEFLVFGGCSKGLQVLGDFWKINFSSTFIDYQWEEISVISKPAPRFSHSAAVNKNNMYISGGLNGKYEPLSDIWVWSCESELWTKLEVQIVPRYGHTSHIVENTLILVGGVSTRSETWLGVTLINLFTLKIIECVLPEMEPCESFMLQNHSSILRDEKSIYIVGGGGNCFSFGTKFNDSILEIPLSQWRLK